jgi:hypothetical protein
MTAMAVASLAWPVPDATGDTGAWLGGESAVGEDSDDAQTPLLLDCIDNPSLGAALHTWDQTLMSLDRFTAWLRRSELLHGAAQSPDTSASASTEMSFARHSVVLRTVASGTVQEQFRLIVIGHVEPNTDPRSSPVHVINEIAAALGVPVGDVLESAGIAQTTFHHWKRNPGSRSRLGSQGELWALAQSVRALAEQLDDRLNGWVSLSPHRRELLRAGRHADLVRELANERARGGDFRDPDHDREAEQQLDEYNAGASAQKQDARPAPTRARAAARVRSSTPRNDR